VDCCVFDCVPLFAVLVFVLVLGVVTLEDDGDVPNVLVDELIEPDVLALPEAFIEPEPEVLVPVEGVVDDEGVVKLDDPVEVPELPGDVDCIVLLPEELVDGDVLDVAEPLDGVELALPPEVCACSPRAAANNAEAPQMISLLGFFIFGLFEVLPALPRSAHLFRTDVCVADSGGFGAVRRRHDVGR
jgi:hypothetical protein